MAILFIPRTYSLGGHQLTEAIDYKINLSQYFNENLSFNTSYWLQYLQEKKATLFLY